MSALAATLDSGNLSGNPSDDIDKQKGPSEGSNAESSGGAVGTPTTAVEGGNNPPNQGSAGKSGWSRSTDNNPAIALNKPVYTDILFL
jgi:hypothetical protein